MRILFSSLLFVISAEVIGAPDHVARIVKIENNSQVYVPLIGKESGQDKLVKYMDKTYKIESATKGMKLDNGFVITTGPESKLKVVFNNGDHFFISPNTQYVVEWKKQHLKQDDPSTMTILRGAVRGLIEKGGPRSGMEVSTKNTIMGIRGTDFHVSQLHSGLTQISVLRGEIEVKNKEAKEPVKIEAGQTLEKKEENVNVAKLSKTELKKISEETVIKNTGPQDNELKKLEQKATQVTIKDIKTYEPELYEKIKNQTNVDSEKLAVTTVETLSRTAPESRKKPAWVDLMDENDPYEKYKPKQ